MTSGYSVEKPNGPTMMTSVEKIPSNPAQAKPEEYQMMQLFHELGNMTKMLGDLQLHQQQMQEAVLTLSNHMAGQENRLNRLEMAEIEEEQMEASLQDVTG